MAARELALTTVLFLLTACRQERLSLPVAHADEEQTQSSSDRTSLPVSPTKTTARPASADIVVSHPGDSCYAFMQQRPKAQRAAAVQVRLHEFDHMAAALDSRTFTVDLVGDHANVLSLQFPTTWPPVQSYAERVSTVVEDYFSAPEVEDNICNSGFSEVRLTARGVNDRQMHPIWTARVTSEGLIKTPADGPGFQGLPSNDEDAASLPTSLPPSVD